MAKLVLKGVLGSALLLVGPFLIAGRWDLPLVWSILGIYTGFLVLSWLLIFRKDPDLLRERQRAGPGAKQWDRTWLAVYGLTLLGTLVFALLDVGRLHWSDSVPLWLQLAALAGFAAALALAGWALAVNRFFSEVVRIQTDRGHHVITTGPYRFVRHPAYLGNLVAWPFMVLVIGSWWALLPAVAIVLLYVLRTALEDRTLREELPGYAEYAQRTRYRLLPGIW